MPLSQQYDITTKIKEKQNNNPKNKIPNKNNNLAKKELNNSYRKKAGTPTPKSTSNLLLKNNQKNPLFHQLSFFNRNSSKGKKKAPSTPRILTAKGTSLVRNYSNKKLQDSPQSSKKYSNLLVQAIDKKQGDMYEINQKKQNYLLPITNLVNMTGKICKVYPKKNEYDQAKEVKNTIEEYANKKLNYHSNSLDKTDWLAFFTKSAKEGNSNNKLKLINRQALSPSLMYQKNIILKEPRKSQGIKTLNCAFPQKSNLLLYNFQ